MSLRVLVSVLLVSLIVAPATAQNRRDAEETERVSRKFKIGANGRFTLSNISGDVVLSSGSGEACGGTAILEQPRASAQGPPY